MGNSFLFFAFLCKLESPISVAELQQNYIMPGVRPRRAVQDHVQSMAEPGSEISV